MQGRGGSAFLDERLELLLAALPVVRGRGWFLASASAAAVAAAAGDAVSALLEVAVLTGSGGAGGTTSRAAGGGVGVEAAGGVGVAAGGVATADFEGSGVAPCQGFGVGNWVRLAHSSGRPPATIAMITKGQAGIRDLVSTVAVGAFSGGLLSAGTSTPGVATAMWGNSWPQDSQTAALTSLTLPHRGLGQTLRCIGEPHLAQKREPDTFSYWQNEQLVASIGFAYGV